MTNDVLSRKWSALPLLTLTLLVAACGQEAGSTPPGTMPDAAGSTLGTKPGPGRAVPKVDNPYATEPAALTDGRRLFVWFNCYGCHGGRAGGGMGPSLRDATWLYGGEDQDIFNSIAEGRPHGMPAWGTLLPEEQIWKLTAYIRSLDSAREPEAPPPNPSFPNPPPRRDVKGVTAGGGPH